MDPNAALTRLRTAIHEYGEADAADIELAVEIGDEVYEAVKALDEWLTMGGFLPDAWAWGGVTPPR